MNAAEAKQKESQVLLPTYDRIPLLLERGKDVYLYDADGRKYLDFVSGIGVNALGYGDKSVAGGKLHAQTVGRRRGRPQAFQERPHAVKSENSFLLFFSKDGLFEI